MLIICVTTIGLVSWALHLMQRAIDDQDFSFMLAGLLVVCAAGALLGVYFLMESYWSFMEQVALNQSMMSNGEITVNGTSIDFAALLED